MNEWPITFSLPCGLCVSGITTWALQHAGILADAGRDVRLVVHQADRGHAEFDVSDLPTLENVRVVHAPSLTDPGDWQLCIRLYSALLPTILLPNNLAESYAVAAALATAQADRLRVVGWNHSDNPYDYACLVYYGPVIHHFVVNTVRCQEQLRRHLPTRRDAMTLIPHGVQIPSVTLRMPLSGRPLRLIYAGRMEQLVKRVLDFIELAELLHEQGVRFEMLLIGDGPQASDVDQAVSRVNDRLKIDGSSIRREPPVPPHRLQDHWTRADVSMLASVHEGLSYQMIEAMACGCVPVISRVDSGAAELMTEGENGFTFPVGDVQAMAKCIAGLSRDEPSLRRMSDAARNTVAEHCGLDRCMVLTAKVWASVEAAPDRPWPTTRSLQMDSLALLGGATVPNDAADRLHRVLKQIARIHGGPVAIYGAGKHTCALASVWADSPVEIVGVIDDDPSRHGRRLWGWPIVGPADAAATEARAVVISSWMHESTIWQHRHILEAAGLRVLRLYGKRSL